MLTLMRALTTLMRVMGCALTCTFSSIPAIPATTCRGRRSHLTASSLSMVPDVLRRRDGPMSTAPDRASSTSGL